MRESATIAAREIQLFWDMARIPTKHERNVIPKIENLFESWKSLQKRAKTRTETQEQEENAFVQDLQNLFDIAHADALEMITVQEDRQFLITQRDGHRGYMAGVDIVLSAKEERIEIRMKKIAQLKHREAVRRAQELLTVNQASTSTVWTTIYANYAVCRIFQY